METLKLPDVIMAILDCRSRFPRATSAALIREYEDDDVFVYIVLLDGNRQPISVGPGTITAAMYVACHLSEDLVAAFGGKKAVVLTLGPGEWGGRPGQTPAGHRRPGRQRLDGRPGRFFAVRPQTPVGIQRGLADACHSRARTVFTSAPSGG
ncbi:MAG TPA: hypothetical protein VGN41_02780 [Streptosporangiaceae bacterium]